MPEIKIKGQTSRVLEDGSKKVISTAADLAFNQLTTFANRLELSKLTTNHLKDGKGEYVNKLLYGLDTKSVTLPMKNKTVNVGITDNSTLANLNYTKTRAYNFSKKAYVKLENPQDIFKVTRNIETMLQYNFPYMLRDGEVVHPTNNGDLKLSKTLEYTVPKHYKECIEQVAEPLSKIVNNLSYKLEDKLQEAEDKLTTSKTDIYLESPQVVKNMGRLYAMLEEYPNIMPLLPQYLLAQPLMQEAYIKGKQKEGVVDLEAHNEYVKMYVKGENYSFFDGITKNVKGNEKSKEKYYAILKNANKELKKKPLTFEAIKAEYEIAKKSLEEMKKLPVWEIRDYKTDSRSLDDADIKELGLDKEIKDDVESFTM